jgi:HPt (histidine-containing phosphotransfer) domain-containing protein
MSAPGIIDVDLLIDSACDDREIAADLVRLYFELTGQEMLRLDEAVANGDFATISAVAHKCAGSSISCGMTRLSELLRNLEQQSAEGIPPDLPDQMEQIKAEMTAVKAAAEKHFDCTFSS